MLFLTPNEINNKMPGFITSHNLLHYVNNINKSTIKCLKPKSLFANNCVVIGCNNIYIKVKDVKILRLVKFDFIVESFNSEGKKVEFMQKYKMYLVANKFYCVN